MRASRRNRRRLVSGTISSRSSSIQRSSNTRRSSNIRRNNNIQPSSIRRSNSPLRSSNVRRRRARWCARLRASRRNRCRRLPALGRTRGSQSRQSGTGSCGTGSCGYGCCAGAEQSVNAATGQYRPSHNRARSGRRYDRGRDADPEDRERPRGVFRPRQDHRPHHHVRCRDRRNGAIRRAAGDRAGLLHAAADRGDQYRRLCRSRRGDAARRDQAHLHRLDVCREPRPARRRAPDLRRLAHRLRTASDGPGR